MNSAAKISPQVNLDRRPAKSRLVIGAELASITAAFLFVGMLVFGVL